MRDFYKLQIWQKSHELTLKVYEVTKQFPKDELFGLTSQLRRACSSIPTNIVEGCGRESNKDFAHFLQIAIGSAAETEYEILLAHELNYIDDSIFEQLSKEVVSIRKMIIGYKLEITSFKP